MGQHHFLIVCFPAQGHLNPSLQLARTLLRMGSLVTLSTTLHIHRRSNLNSVTIPGLSFAPFSDGYDDGYKPHHDDDDTGGLKTTTHHYFSDLRRRGSDFLSNLISSLQHSSGGASHPFTCILHTMLLPWATELARQLHLPSALLWVQPATLFAIFHYYFKDHNLIKNKLDDDDEDEDSSGHSVIIELPGLPPLKRSELPSFIASKSSSDMYATILPMFEEDLRILQQEPNPTVLINTFEGLESEALRSVHDSFKTIAIGPLVPSILLEGGEKKQPSDEESPNNDYMQWLSSKAESSVIYISFGSLCVLSKGQMEEIARGLIDSGRPFLWSIREDKEQEKVREYVEEMEEKGKIVRWCDQVQILSHKSVGCFVSHCGWNSTLESLVAGVPVVGLPQWADQPTNAKLMDQVWKAGVRATAEDDGDGGGIVRGGEMKRCVEEVMGNGERGKEVREKAAKWREVSREAVKVGGSSHENLKTFLDKLGGAPNN